MADNNFVAKGTCLSVSTGQVGGVSISLRARQWVYVLCNVFPLPKIIYIKPNEEYSNDERKISCSYGITWGYPQDCRAVRKQRILLINHCSCSCNTFASKA